MGIEHPPEVVQLRAAARGEGRELFCEEWPPADCIKGEDWGYRISLRKGEWVWWDQVPFSPMGTFQERLERSYAVGKEQIDRCYEESGDGL